MARRHVTVCLTGDGGDELFAGYRRYATIGREWPRRDGLRLRALARLGGLATAEGRFGNRVERLREQRFEAYYARFRNNYSVTMRRRLFTADVADAIDMDETQNLFQRVALVEGAGPEAGAQLADLQGYLTDDILVKVDRMSMAHGLEARVPLLDHELLELVQGLPHSYKRHAGRSKRILVDLIRPHLPPGVLDHPKHGFSIPLGSWFRAELRERLRDAVFGPSFATGGLFRPRYVRRLYELHQSRRLDLSFPLWQLLVFDEWWRSHGEPPGWGPA
jgi:asparagine synthase (glutamine-hydrolysing)